jgi:hypothetical protein
MYKTMHKNNYGVIADVEKLNNRQYEVIGDQYLISQLAQLRPELIQYDKKTNIATTNCPENLQIVINSTSRFKDYQFIFVK